MLAVQSRDRWVGSSVKRFGLSPTFVDVLEVHETFEGP
jgi:hypothetical protein